MFPRSNPITSAKKNDGASWQRAVLLPGLMILTGLGSIHVGAKHDPTACHPLESPEAGFSTDCVDPDDSAIRPAIRQYVNDTLNFTYHTVPLPDFTHDFTDALWFAETHATFLLRCADGVQGHLERGVDVILDRLKSASAILSAVDPDNATALYGMALEEVDELQSLVENETINGTQGDFLSNIEGSTNETTRQILEDEGVLELVDCVQQSLVVVVDEFLNRTFLTVTQQWSNDAS